MDTPELKTEIAETEKDLVRLEERLKSLRAAFNEIKQEIAPDANPYADFDSIAISDIESQWISTHYMELQGQYGGEWIAVQGNTVMAHGERLLDVCQAAAALGASVPFTEWIPPLDDVPGILAV